MPISSLNGILIAANTGLRASQIQLDLVSRNVTNASVDGYTRKDAPLETLVNGLSAQGVNAGEIRRSVSSSLLQEIRAGHSIAETMRVKEDYLARLETLFGAPGDGSSIVAKLGNLANSFRALIGEPDSAALQQQVLLRADDFASSVNALSETIQNLRLDAERTIEAQVTIANGYITQLDQLNTTIAQNRGLNRSTADLDDRRDKLIADLSKIIDIRTFEQSNGQVLVLTKLGRPLVDNDAHQLSFNASSSISPAMNYAGGDLSGILLDGVDISSEIVGGKFRGLLDTRDDNMVTAQAQLDELVSRVAQNFALSDLDLFDYGDVETVVTGRSATATATGGSTSFTVSSAAGISTGMNLRFANHPTTYLVTGVAGTTISVQPATGAGTGLDIDVPSGTAMIFAAQPGPASAGCSIRVVAPARRHERVDDRQHLPGERHPARHRRQLRARPALHRERRPAHGPDPHRLRRFGDRRPDDRARHAQGHARRPGLPEPAAFHALLLRERRQRRPRARAHDRDPVVLRSVGQGHPGHAADVRRPHVDRAVRN
jgi:flagellar hook-associated protein FlgK